MFPLCTDAKLLGNGVRATGEQLYRSDIPDFISNTGGESARLVAPVLSATAFELDD